MQHDKYPILKQLVIRLRHVKHQNRDDLVCVSYARGMSPVHILEYYGLGNIPLFHHVVDERPYIFMNIEDWVRIVKENEFPTIQQDLLRLSKLNDIFRSETERICKLIILLFGDSLNGGVRNSVDINEINELLVSPNRHYLHRFHDQ